MEKFKYGSEEYKAAKEKINACLREANDALDKAVAIADATGVSFRWDGPTYGAGASYTPGEVVEDSYGNEMEDGWLASSQSC